jgi:hypothetical protein
MLRNSRVYHRNTLEINVTDFQGIVTICYGFPGYSYGCVTVPVVSRSFCKTHADHTQAQKRMNQIARSLCRLRKYTGFHDHTHARRREHRIPGHHAHACTTHAPHSHAHACTTHAQPEHACTTHAHSTCKHAEADRYLRLTPPTTHQTKQTHNNTVPIINP